MAATETSAVPRPHLLGQRGIWARITPSSRWYWVRVLARNRVAIGSAIIVLLIALLAIFAGLVAPSDPTYVDPSVRLRGPSREHPLGTDAFGRDVLSRVIFGARVSLLIGITVTAAAALFGSVLGLLSGYYNRLDGWIMRTMDGLMAFPSILLAIAIMASLGPGGINVFLALVVVYTPSIARLVRGSTLVLRRQPYVESARAIGLRDATILRRYIFPNALSPLIVQCTFVIAFAIISEASLSFLGAGVNPETPTWGNMLREGQLQLQRAWWLAIVPGCALVLTVLSLNMLGDGLRDALDPRARER
jgi:peptide/nickel transport system permease protein